MAAARQARGFTLTEIMLVVGILGVLAALAIPAFQKYLRRSKTMEAVRSVRSMFDASVAYYADEHSDRQGMIVQKQFPASTGTTPSEGCCKYPNGQCPAEGPLFEADDTWAAISFVVSDPHYYTYTYESAGLDTTSQFSARANGDLNCNGILSTFERVGAIEGGEYVTGSALYKHLPIE